MPSTQDHQEDNTDRVTLCVIDCHRFACDATVPDEICERLGELSENNAKFSDVPAEYLKYEVEFDPWDEIDNVIIDGRVFAVNYEVPPDVTAALIELAKREGTTYADIPRAYRRFEDFGDPWVRDPDYPMSAITYVQCGSCEEDSDDASDEDEERGKKDDDKPKEETVKVDK